MAPSPSHSNINSSNTLQNSRISNLPQNGTNNQLNESQVAILPALAHLQTTKEFRRDF
jgi:hypothetical protein